MDLKQKFLKVFDHTLLKPDATKEQFKKLCEEAVGYIEYIATVCVPQIYVPECKYMVSETDVKVCTVVGFPHGSNLTYLKVEETKNAVLNGADEIDMVQKIYAIKEKNYDTVLNDIKSVVEAAKGRTVKVILENCYLNDEEKRKSCLLAHVAGADFVKTSTGFGSYGAKVEDVKLMYETIGDKLKIKAAGGIKTFGDAKAMIEAGATRLGTSGTVEIIKELEKALYSNQTNC